MKEEMQQQTAVINENMAITMDKKLKPLVEETASLKKEVHVLKSKIYFLEKDARKNNLILHGVPETETHFSELLAIVTSVLDNVSDKANLNTWDKWEISNAYRIGKKTENKIRPICVTLTLQWRRNELLRNKKYLPENIYVTEDYPKEVLLVRKELKNKLKEELEKGKEGYIAYDRLIIKEKNEKRKRSPTESPNTPNTETRILKNKPKLNKTNSFFRAGSSENNKTQI
ncbi:hypothetical protein MSG28_008593 [Choristoneura fumiferana]|uniref:Uncharacterized protein n=1 Tax=Choristoneura fumiferana TaxID=7141 RepID=A0ACC0J7B0_CHOFU|nr:hypothetical protein MSG28_008593 [Choristoneura fumiferana]